MKILRLLSCLLAAALTAVGQTNIVGSGFGMGSTSGSSGGSGTVTSVGLTIGGFTVTGSPVTSSGTLAATLSSPVANGIVTSTSGGNLQATSWTVSGNTITSPFAATITDNGSGGLSIVGGTTPFVHVSTGVGNFQVLTGGSTTFQVASAGASLSEGLFNGAWFVSGGTGTTTWPALLVQPTGTTTTTWSTSGTGIGVNAASGFAGNEMDLQHNGTSDFSVNTLGYASVRVGYSAANGSATTPSVVYAGSATTGTYWANPGLGFSVAGTSVGTWVASGLSVVGNISATGSAVFTGAGFKANSASTGIGYTTGAGGAVTQLTSRSTGVTLNTVTGAITGINTSLAATTAVTFTVTDSAVAATDKILVHLVSGGAVTTSYYCSAVTAGSFNITLYNENTVTADTTTPVMGFEVLKGTSN